jgi:hypothetical protein
MMPVPIFDGRTKMGLNECLIRSWGWIFNITVDDDAAVGSIELWLLIASEEVS